MNIFAAAFLFSFDSFFASFTLAAFGMKRSRYIPMALAFGLCDGFASLVGMAFGVGHRGVTWMVRNDMVFDVVTCLVLACVILRSRKGRTEGSRLVWTAPVVLSLDNLANLYSLSFSYGSVVVFTVVSSSLSLLGFELVAYARRRFCSWDAVRSTSANLFTRSEAIPPAGGVFSPPA
jgi:hypothetical protein